MSKTYLTTKEVARLCRVSDATVKRWEDAGMIVSERTSGGHRRFRADVIARFQKEKGLGIRAVPGDGSVVTALTRKRDIKDHSPCSLYHALVGGREEEAAGIFINEFLKGAPLYSLFDGILAAAMRRVGELWVQGELTVAQEHLATRTAISAIHKLRSALPATELSGKLALCCVIEGDFHELNSTLAQVVLESEGFEVINFGANTPLFSFADEVVHYNPAIVCISCTIMTNIERAQRDHREFLAKVARVRPAVFIGGQAFADESVRARFPADTFLTSFTDLATAAMRVLEKAA
jgi:excisionase family DNA binding protein